MNSRLVGVLLSGLISVTGYVDRGTTADGTPTGPGIAACPPEFTFGTTVYVETVGTLTCHDRTPGNPWLIDVWVPTVADAYAVTCVAEHGCRRMYVVVQ